MRLRVLGRHDSVLFAGLMFALLVVFQSPIQQALDGAREIEQTHGVALMPALLILTVMFVFHQYGKRREMKAEAAAAAAEAELARGRALDLEQLMLLGQALARALSTDALREAVWRHLPSLADGRDVWLLLRTDDGWERLTDTGCSRWPAGELEACADEAVTAPREVQERGDGFETGAHFCFPLLVGTRPVGLLGCPASGLADRARHKLGAAAALLTIGIKNARLFADVRDHSVKDGLTGCFNRTHTLEILEGEIARARRSRTALSVLLFDVDRFKQINDRHGHLCGDAVLAAVGQRIRQVLRRSDIRCRYGGDEFLVLLPETSETGAIRVAEWLRGELEQPMLSPSGERLPVTISVGVATTEAGRLTATALIDRADRALYQAKAAGRNCVRASDDPSDYAGEAALPVFEELHVTH
jgi:diguanylate cyclase (GGDEF)-like protein